MSVHDHFDHYDHLNHDDHLRSKMVHLVPDDYHNYDDLGDHDNHDDHDDHDNHPVQVDHLVQFTYVQNSTFGQITSNYLTQRKQRGNMRTAKEKGVVILKWLLICSQDLRGFVGKVR